MPHASSEHTAQAQENKSGNRGEQYNVQELKSVVHAVIFKLGLVKFPIALM